MTKFPDHPGGLLGLLKSNLMLGEFSEAKKIMDEFPPSPEYPRMEVIRPLYIVMAKDISNIEKTDDPLEAQYRNAIRLISRGFIPASMDGLLDVLRQDKHYHNEEVRKVLLGLFEVLGANHPLTLQYRKELSIVLF